MLKPSVLIADDHILVAEACKKLLESEYEIVAMVCDGREMVRAALELKPAVVLADIAMPLLNGLDAGRQIKSAAPSIKLIYLTMYADVDLAAEAFRRKASGFLVKTCAASELLLALRTVLRGGTFLSPVIPRDTFDFLVRQKGGNAEEQTELTDRQREVLQLLAEGKSMKAVAAILSVATRTVAFHKYRMMEMLKVRTNAELIQYAMKHHIVAA
jgi:DNA-binding NarL/FixJ family response regulator